MEVGLGIVYFSSHQYHQIITFFDEPLTEALLPGFIELIIVMLKLSKGEGTVSFFSTKAGV